MLRAISYTVLFCGVSAGAAFALAMAHEAQFFTPASEISGPAPEMAALPEMTEEPIAVSFADPGTDMSLTPRVAPVLEPIQQEASTEPMIDNTAPASDAQTETPVQAAAPVAPMPRFTASAPRQVVGMSTQGRGEFAPTQYGTVLPDAEIARSVPAFEASSGTAPARLGRTWSTGVYR